ncbi:hypothetical protein AYI69_g9476 [Smittium culicis]|uniref:Uncharacterized protein n=1 Tax=Smittium culicis TaxID=133412 RepID=A0A1R1XC91_9FUNG|nr:hypothetical protein AYI69_g9476 [Smittium culicis]
MLHQPLKPLQTSRLRNAGQIFAREVEAAERGLDRDSDRPPSLGTPRMFKSVWSKHTYSRWFWRIVESGFRIPFKNHHSPTRGSRSPDTKIQPSAEFSPETLDEGLSVPH